MEKTLRFLKDIKQHNSKEWFDTNKEKYLSAKEEYGLLVDQLIKGVSRFDKQISQDMQAKDCTFRIYKDVRFSKDKTPYKTNMGASINPGGKKSLVAGYYFHLEPGASFIAGGIYMPEPAILNAVRQEIDYNPDPLLKILKSAGFKKYFKGLDEEGKLKTMPKGFTKDHPQIELLKNKHFLVSFDIPDKVLNTKELAGTIVSGFKAMHPFLLYLREAVAK